MDIKHELNSYDGKELTEELEKLLEQLLPKNKRAVIFRLIMQFADNLEAKWKDGELDYKEVKPLQKAADLLSISPRQIRKYLKGESEPSAKVINNALDYWGPSVPIYVFYYDLLDKLELIYEVFPSMVKAVAKERIPPHDYHNHFHWDDLGLGEKLMVSDPRFTLTKEDEEYILEREKYEFIFSDVKFRASEEKMEEFFDSDQCPYEGDWSSYQEELDNKFKFLRRLEGNPDLTEHVRNFRFLSTITGRPGMPSLLKFTSENPFKEDINAFQKYKQMITALWDGCEEDDIFKGWSEEQIDRFLEFAEQLNLNEEKKSTLKKLLNEGKEDE